MSHSYIRVYFQGSEAEQFPYGLLPMNTYDNIMEQIASYATFITLTFDPEVDIWERMAVRATSIKRVEEKTAAQDETEE